MRGSGKLIWCEVGTSEESQKMEEEVLQRFIAEV
jgi:hypothetical protein